MSKKSNKKKKSENIDKRQLFLGIGLFVVLSLSMFLFNFHPITPGVTGNFIWTEDYTTNQGLVFGNTDLNLSKFTIIRYLFFIIVSMLVYWAVEFVVTGRKLAKTIFSVIVSYLTINFILGKQLLSIVTTYTALGATFTTILPFIVLMLFLGRLTTEGELTASKVFIQKFIWGTYAIFVIYYLITTFESASRSMNLIMLGIAIISSTFALITEKTWIGPLVKMTAKVIKLKHALDKSKSDVAFHEENARKAMKKLQENKEYLKKLQDELGKRK